MAIDVSERHSPGWWVQYLTRKLEERNRIIDPLYARYEGETPEPESLRHAPEAARRFFKLSRVGFAEMIVKAVKYPLTIQSITTNVDDSASGDSEAWRILKSSGMLRATDQLFKDFLVSGRAYGIVHEYDGGHYFTAEDPRQMYAVSHPFIPGRIRAALKRFHDEIEGHTVVRLWVDGRTYRLTSPGETLNLGRAEWDENAGAEAGLEFGSSYGDEPPVYEFISEDAVGEFQRHTDDLDRVDHLILQGMTIATMQAFKQRAIKADKEQLPDEDPDTGQPIDYDNIFAADPGAIWRLPESAEIWESGNLDLTPIWTGVDRAIQILSAVTFTPLAMFQQEGANQSAAGATFAREARTFKVEDRQPRLAAPLERALAMIFRLRNADDSRADPANLSVVWKPAERYSLAEKSDAMTKLTAVPWESRMVDVMQYSATDVERMKRQRVDDAMAEMMMGFEQQEQGQPVEDETHPPGNATDLGALIRAGVRPQSAAKAAGFENLDFWDNARPITIREHGD